MLAANFRNRNVAFAWFTKDAEPAVAAQLAADAVPRLLVAYVDPEAKPDGQGRVPLGVQAFEGKLNYKNMAAFTEAVASRFGGGAEARHLASTLHCNALPDMCGAATVLSTQLAFVHVVAWRAVDVVASQTLP